MNLDDPSASHRSLAQRLLHLLQAARDTDDVLARAELNTLLRENADARATMPRLMVDEQALISRFRDDSIVALLEPVQAAVSPLRTGRRWLAWRPLTAAAAGLLIGLFSASMVFGFGVRPLERVVSVFLEDFENGATPLVTGMPRKLNQWSGDFSEIVGEQQGIKPKDGGRMVRLLRSDFEGKTSSKPSRQGDLMRVVDVRPFLREAGGGEVVITLSALLNAAPFPEAKSYDGAVTLWALGPSFPTEETLMQDALAHSVGMCRPLDRDGNTWQNASTRLLLPPGTEMVLLKVSFSPKPENGRSMESLADHVSFSGHFVDDVRASVTIRKPVSNRRSQALP
jgi:hypothetical protein